MAQFGPVRRGILPLPLSQYVQFLLLESPRPVATSVPATAAREKKPLVTPEVSSTTGIPPTLVYPPTDAANGLRFDVVEAAGSGASMVVNFQISTCLVPV